MKKAKLGMGCYLPNCKVNPTDLIEYAYNKGIRFFDTSIAYGDSEIWVGRALSGYERDSFIVSTKTKATDSTQLSIDFHNSYKRLGVMPNIYFAHSSIDDMETWNKCIDGEVFESMQMLKKYGDIAQIGVSGHSLKACYEAINSGFVDVIMVPFSIAYQKFFPAMEAAKSKGIKVITMKNYASGILLGGPEDNIYKKDITLQDIMDFTSFYGDYIIPAPRDYKQLDQILDVYNSADELDIYGWTDILDRIYKYLGINFCVFCNECRPCNIHGWMMSQPGILKSAIYHEKFGLDMKKTYEKYKLNALNCKDCNNKCSERCPFGIDIKLEMQRIHTLFKGDGMID